MQEERKQPKYDLEPVLDATIDDLNQDVLNAVVSRNKMITPRIFGKMSSEEILIKLGALVKINGIVYPTLGALLAAGIYPQQFFPRLNITFTVYSGTTKAQEKDQIFKYIDSKQINGSIPEMLIDARDFLLKNMRSGAVIEGSLRKDIYDYPLDAFREAVVNALQHRDYSPEGCSSQVQINLFSDRLEILNPGGIYGPASIDDNIHGISSTRNVNLSRLLECVPYEDEVGNKGYVIENRGTGLIQIRSALNRELMPPPKISDCISSFSIVFSKRRLSENERSYKRAKNLSEAILAEFAKHETLSIAEISSWSSVNRRTVSLHLNRLVEQGKLERTAPLRSPKQRFRLKI
ncbi:ATP-binding protein [Succinatimonas hippei]|uniref:ATP-binding protein n=1 Tax=Succinatimonas hippei TaxID=626938 RepID=UPI0031ECD6DD